jgi:alkylation response protein AidB-like acyl-CoA dehydrogenase
MTTPSFRFDPVELPPEAKELRQEVRTFLRQEADAGTFSPYGGKGSFSRESSRKIGAKGWIGMTWPKNTAGMSARISGAIVASRDAGRARGPRALTRRPAERAGHQRYGRGSSQNPATDRPRRTLFLHRAQRAHRIGRVRGIDGRPRPMVGGW